MRTLANQKTVIPEADNSTASRPHRSSSDKDREPSPEKDARLHSESGSAKIVNGSPEAPIQPSAGTHDFGKISVLPSQKVRLQPKLKINKPGDKYEREADRVAEEVMRMPDNAVTRPLHDGKTLQNELRDKSGNGQPLPQSVRAFFEPRFGVDFSRVRIVNNPKSALLANSIQAKAFTAGNNIFFGDRHFAPNTQEGKKLIGHELTHVMQQNSLQGTPNIQRKDDCKDYDWEKMAKTLSPEELKSWLEYLDAQFESPDWDEVFQGSECQLGFNILKEAYEEEMGPITEAEKRVEWHRKHYSRVKDIPVLRHLFNQIGAHDSFFNSLYVNLGAQLRGQFAKLGKELQQEGGYVKFTEGYLSGVLVGIKDGALSWVEDLLSIFLYTDPTALIIQYFLNEDEILKTFFDQESRNELYWKLLKFAILVEGAKKAIFGLALEFGQDRSILQKWYHVAGGVLGKELGKRIREEIFKEPNLWSKGYEFGRVVGAIIAEIIIDIIISILTRGIGNLGRLGLKIRRAAKAGKLGAKLLDKLTDISPSLKRLKKLADQLDEYDYDKLMKLLKNRKVDSPSTAGSGTGKAENSADVQHTTTSKTPPQTTESEVIPEAPKPPTTTEPKAGPRGSEERVDPHIPKGLERVQYKEPKSHKPKPKAKRKYEGKSKKDKNPKDPETIAQKEAAKIKQAEIRAEKQAAESRRNQPGEPHEKPPEGPRSEAEISVEKAPGTFGSPVPEKHSRAQLEKGRQKTAEPNETVVDKEAVKTQRARKKSSERRLEVRKEVTVKASSDATDSGKNFEKATNKQVKELAKQDSASFRGNEKHPFGTSKADDPGELRTSTSDIDILHYQKRITHPDDDKFFGYPEGQMFLKNSDGTVGEIHLYETTQNKEFMKGKFGEHKRRQTERALWINQSNRELENVPIFYNFISDGPPSEATILYLKRLLRENPNLKIIWHRIKIVDP